MTKKFKKIGESENTEYFVHSDNILIVSPVQGYKDNAKAANINMDFQLDFANKLERKCGLVVILNNLLSQDADARKIYSDRTDPDLFFGIALVVNNPLSRAIASFFVGLSKPKIPLTIVNSVESGIVVLETANKEK
ncbi:MAG: hypothetical protein NT007_13535 [Candidatus Kapabacteria bacterium]|nr:hypothetical protein [Candidatus Kapabacteria bacterium]